MGTINKQAARLKEYTGCLQEAIDKIAGFDSGTLERLYTLAEAEVSGEAVLEIELPLSASSTIPLSLGRCAKAARLGGEWPHYLAMVVALWFHTVEKISPKDLKQAMAKKCGLTHQREFTLQVAEAFSQLPALDLDIDTPKVQLMKQAYRKGFDNEKIYRGCAQCCMAAVSDMTGKEDSVMFRAANGLAAGMGLLGDGACGGYSGGILSLGMFAGRRKEFFDGDKAEKDLSMLLVGKLHEKFIKAYGSVICHDIHRSIFDRAFHITQADDKVAFEAAGAHSLDKCPAVVGAASAWTVEIVYDQGLL